jgi:membrane protein DedA with SNARE-associated domain
VSGTLGFKIVGVFGLDQIYRLIHALMEQDTAALSDPRLALMLYIIVASFMILENGFLPTAFLPGDSLLVLTGVLIYEDVLVWWIVIPLLIASSFLGTWLGYLQGKFFGHTKIYHRLMSHVDEEHRDRAFRLLTKHGILTLICARYIAFVRTVYPCLIGVAGVPLRKFLSINFISSILWVLPLVGFGFAISHSSLVERYKQQFLGVVIYLPLVLLIIGVIALLARQLRKSKSKAPKD